MDREESKILAVLAAARLALQSALKLPVIPLGAEAQEPRAAHYPEFILGQGAPALAMAACSLRIGASPSVRVIIGYGAACSHS